MDEKERLVIVETTLRLHIAHCAETKGRLQDIERRVRAIEKYQWIGFGALGLLQFIAPYVIHSIFSFPS